MNPAGVARLSFMACALLLVFAKNSSACLPPPGPPPPPTPLSQLYREYPAVFVAKVVDIRWSLAGTMANEVRLSVVQGVKGTVGTEFTVDRPGSSCDPTLIFSDIYLIFARDPQRGSLMSTSSFFVSIPLPYAAEGLKYIEAIRSNRPQALLYGRVQRYDNGNPSSTWWSEQFTLQAEANGTVLETQTLVSGLYHFSLLPGTYTVRLLRNGQPASEPQTVRLESGDETLRYFDSIPAPR